MSHSLNEQIVMDPSKSDYDILEESFRLYELEIKNRQKRPELFGRQVYINVNPGPDGKDYGFWHIASIGEDDTKFDMFPCENHIAHRICRYKCDSEHQDNFLQEINSVPCIYRAHRVNWIKEIIDLANKDRNHPNLRIWQQAGKKGKRLLIRFINEDVSMDYVLVFQIEYKPNKSDIRWYRLITGYPVVLKSYKKRFNKEFLEYKGRKK
ncbi:hypothetical protein J1P26_22455 [Neobacillus sp. MM2021_6]|uniref:hypothetical protein n=1 Tax=Bacillaceae TaxID=186817 RepID=UPI00140BAFFB|nr:MULTISPECIES: hypothetical protein [Bacillaceae]MBO0962459.1 hypothetical protein [Neobacillus sp. MM2021_6]